MDLKPTGVDQYGPACRSFWALRSLPSDGVKEWFECEQRCGAASRLLEEWEMNGSPSDGGRGLEEIGQCSVP